MGTIQVTLNYLGIPLNTEQIDTLLIQANSHPQTAVESGLIESFFGLPFLSLPREALERYCEISTKDMYAPILPHSSKLFERLVSPLKSAKRCYCLGEYLATIELSAHVGEMLTQLTWQITPIVHNQSRVTEEFEKGILGREFEKLGQDRRISVLKTFGAISELQAGQFDDLRKRRIRFFHLWSTDVEDIKSDARSCYKIALLLTQEILQIGISPLEPGRVTINPLLSAFLHDTGEWEEST